LLILSIDSAGSACSACLWQDGLVLAEACEAMERGQDQRILPMLISLLSEAKKSFADIDRIAVTRGPGSFTGLRIGLAAARGIGFAASKPVLGIDRFSIYREQIKRSEHNLLVVLHSKRAELYCALYSPTKPEPEINMMKQEDILIFLQDHPKTKVSGDCEDLGLPNFAASKELEVITSARIASNLTVNDAAYMPRPLYVRPPDVTIKAKPIEA